MINTSDTTWMGILPSSWDTIELGQVYEERNVKIKETEYAPLSVTMNGIVPQLSSAVKAAEDSDRKLVLAGDYVINSRSDRKGACGVSPSDGTCSVINIVITPRMKETAAYYNYALLTSFFSEEFYRWGHGIASDLWTTRWSEMRKIKLPNPPDIIKQRIIKQIEEKCVVLDSLEKKTQDIIAFYKQLKSSYMEELLTKGILPCDNWRDSGERAFGLIPSHWGMVRIKRVFSIRKDIAGQSGLPVLSITQKGIIPKDISRNEGQTASDYNNYQLVHIDDYAMNHMDLRTGWVDLSQYEGVTSPDYRVFYINDEEKYNKRFYMYVMQYCYLKEAFYSAAQGINENGRYRLKTDTFLHYEIVLPPLEEQQAIADALDRRIGAIDSIIEQKELLLSKLKAYKKSIFYDFVTGKKEVPA